MNNTRTDKMFGGMSVQTIALFITSFLEMLMFSFWSRHLTKTEFGFMAAISGVLAIVDCIAEAGLGAAIVQKKDSTKEFVSTVFSLSFVLGIAGTLVVFAFAPLLANLVSGNDYLSTPLRVMSITVLLKCLLSVANNQLVKQLRFKRKAAISIISYILSCGIGIAMIYMGYSLYALIIAYVSCPLINFIILYTTGLTIPKFHFEKGYIRGIVSYGGWLTAGSIVNTFTQKADTLMLSRLISVDALGAYNRPAGFVNNISSRINSVFDSVLFPLLSDIQDEKAKIKDVLLRSISLLNSCSIVLAALFFFNAELIITVFFGKQWVELVPIMRIVSLALIFNVDSRLVDCFFRSLNLVRLGAILRFVQGGLTIVAIIIGARYDIIGVAYAITICEIFVILMKVLALVLSVKVSVSAVVLRWFLSWRSVIPFLAISIPYMFIPHSFVVNIIFALLFAIMLIIAFVIYPKLIGEEYVRTVTPQIEKIVKKFRRK